MARSIDFINFDVNSYNLLDSTLNSWLHIPILGIQSGQKHYKNNNTLA